MEESYLPKYSEYEAETFTKGTLGIYLQPVNVSNIENVPKLLVLVF